MRQTVCDRCHLVTPVADITTPIGDLLSTTVHIEAVIPPELVANLQQAYAQAGQVYKPFAIDLCAPCRAIMRAALGL